MKKTGFVKLRWRVGRKLKRTIYAMIGTQPADHDILLGMMDTEEIAQQVVRDHNAQLNLVKD